MVVQTDNLLAGIVVLAIMLGAFWLVIESAVGAAIGRAHRRPAFRASLHTAGEAVELAIDNTGPAPAYDVEVRWRGDRRSDPLLRTSLLAQGETWRAAAPAASRPTEASDARWPGLGWLEVRYRRDAPPEGAVLIASVAILVPAPTGEPLEVRHEPDK